jgi:hypothetical protein
MPKVIAVSVSEILAYKLALFINNHHMQHLSIQTLNLYVEILDIVR